MEISTLTTGHTPSVAVIALHGLSGDEYSMKPVAVSTRLTSAAWYFPRAPYPAEAGGHSWFEGSDRTGWEYSKTTEVMREVMARVAADRFAASNVFIVGFSQGASLAIEFALRLPFALGGIVPIAGLIKYPDRLAVAASVESIATPVLLMHGTEDSVVPPVEAEKSRDFLSARGHAVTLRLYTARHKIPTAATRWIREFIEERGADGYATG